MRAEVFKHVIINLFDGDENKFDIVLKVVLEHNGKHNDSVKATEYLSEIMDKIQEEFNKDIYILHPELQKISLDIINANNPNDLLDYLTEFFVKERHLKTAYENKENFFKIALKHPELIHDFYVEHSDCLNKIGYQVVSIK